MLQVPRPPLHQAFCALDPNSHETEAWQAVPICAAEPPESSDGLSHPSIGGDPPSPGATLSGLQKE